MSRALVHARARFETTPRSLDDDELTRIARGDRGCMADVLSFIGALALVATVILGATETISFSWTYVAMGLWISAFAWGTVAQTRSGKLRKAALESGPLVLGVVLRDEAWLRRPGKRVGRAVVLFSTDEQRRFDRAWLEQHAEQLRERLEASPGGADWVPLRALLVDPDAFGMHRVPAELFDANHEAHGTLWLASVVVHPERLDGGYLGYEDDREAGERDEDLDGPTRAPTIVAIVAPEHGFIEQVPHTTRSSG